MLQGIDDDGVAAMGYVQLHGGSVSPEAALQAVRDMREGLAGGLQVGASGVLCYEDDRA